MSDEREAILKVKEFLKDNSKKSLLVRGYDNDAKVRVVLSCLNEYFGVGIIRTSSMEYESSHINDAFKGKLLPNSITSRETYKMGRMELNISSYASNTRRNPPGNENTFTIFHPVQTVLDNPKRYSAFLEEINSCKSRKIILITTNEWIIKNLDIENLVDDVFFYSVENDNPEIMSNLRSNGAI